MTDSTYRVWLEGGNPYDFDSDDLTELSLELEGTISNVDFVPFVRQERGYGVTFNEVLVIWEEISRNAPKVEQSVEDLAKMAVLVAGAVAWLRRRWKRDHERNGERARPRTLVVCDKHSRVVRSVRIDMPEGLPVDEFDQIGQQYPRPSPGAIDKPRRS